MMEFLDKIYSYENFGIILFSVITALGVLFLIILLFGKNDEKKRKLEETRKLEQLENQNMDAFAMINDVPTQVEVPLVEEPSLVPPIINNIEESSALNTKPEETLSFPAFEPITENYEPASIIPDAPIVEPVLSEAPIAPILNPIEEPAIAPALEPEVEASPIVEESSIMPEIPVPPVAPIEAAPIVEEPVATVEETPEIKIPEFNFDELAASIASELESLEKNNNQKTVSELINEEVKTPSFDIPTTPVDVPVTPIKEIVKPTPGPITFSSVYINKPAEPTVPVTPAEPITPVVNEQVAPVEPVAPVVHQEVVRPVVRPEIDLPKPAEMPALKSEVKPAVEPVKPVTAVPDFSQFEGESYNIK